MFSVVLIHINEVKSHLVTEEVLVILSDSSLQKHWITASMSNSISIEIEPGEIVSWLKKSLQYKLTSQGVLSQRIVERETQLRGVQLSDAEVQAVGDQFRLTHKLEKAVDTIAWLQSEMITAEQWEAGIRDRLLMSKLKEVMFGADVERFIK
jgi:hypothetical protein